MSSTTTTQYYGLTQYIGTDKPDWTDNNEAFREVDADLHEAVQSMEGFGTDITELQQAQSALTTEVTGLEADLNTEKAKITALQNKETLQDAAIADVKADALDMITAVDEGTAQVATVAVSEGKYFRYNDVMYIATTNIAVGDTIVPNTNCRATNVGTELEAQAEDIAEVKSDLTGVDISSQLTLSPTSDVQFTVNDSKFIKYGGLKILYMSINLISIAGSGIRYTIGSLASNRPMYTVHESFNFNNFIGEVLVAPDGNIDIRTAQTGSGNVNVTIVMF